MGFGIMDWYIIVPNGVGSILGFIQMFLRLVVPCRDLFESSDENDEEEGEPSSAVKDDDIKPSLLSSISSAHITEELTKNGVEVFLDQRQKQI